MNVLVVDQLKTNVLRRHISMANHDVKIVDNINS